MEEVLFLNTNERRVSDLIIIHPDCGVKPVKVTGMQPISVKTPVYWPEDIKHKIVTSQRCVTFNLGSCMFYTEEKKCTKTDVKVQICTNVLIAAQS